MEHILFQSQVCVCVCVCVNISNFKEFSNIDVEVRDSRTGYLVPVRDGPGLLPDWESCWDAVAAAVTWKFRLTFWPGNYIWSLQIGI